MWLQTTAVAPGVGTGWCWGGWGRIPVPQVVIFSAPAPEGIRKAIDFPKLFYSQAAHATKKLCVGKPEKDSARLEIQSCVSLQTRLFSYNAGVELRGSPSRARGLSITP